MAPFEQRALAVLAEWPMGCSDFGARLWTKRSGRVCSVNGGGDYAAQMALGRLRRKGWARVLPGEGSSVWTITPAGMTDLRAAKKGPDDAR